MSSTPIQTDEDAAPRRRAPRGLRLRLLLTDPTGARVDLRGARIYETVDDGWPGRRARADSGLVVAGECRPGERVALPHRAVPGLPVGCAVRRRGCRRVAAPARRSGRGPDHPLLLEKFFLSNLIEPTIKPGSVDFVYSGDVRHHTADTRRAPETVAPTVKSGGRIYAWLYWRVPGWSMAAKRTVRRVTCRLPTAIQQSIVVVLAFPPYLLDRDRAWRDHRLINHDYYTPRYL